MKISPVTPRFGTGAVVAVLATTVALSRSNQNNGGNEPPKPDDSPEARRRREIKQAGQRAFTKTLLRVAVVGSTAFLAGTAVLGAPLLLIGVPASWVVGIVSGTVSEIRKENAMRKEDARKAAPPKTP